MAVATYLFILVSTVMAWSVTRAFLMNAQVSRRQAIIMGSGSLLLCSSTAKPTFEEGTVNVPREEKTKKFSIYYRMYSRDEPAVPMVVVHGGPYVPLMRLLSTLWIANGSRSLTQTRVNLHTDHFHHSIYIQSLTMYTAALFSFTISLVVAKVTSPDRKNSESS